MQNPVPDPVTNTIAAMYATHYARMVRMAARLLGAEDRAADAVQDVFRKLLAEPPAYITSGFIWSCLEHRCLDILRMEGRRQRHLKQLRCDVTSDIDAQEAEEAVGRAEATPDPCGRLQRLMQRNKKRLTRRQWQVLTMTGAGKSDEQIARALHIESKTVANHRALGTKAIRDAERERERERGRERERLIRWFRRAAAPAPTTS
jgi:DNA-directed RNA polymerase specialized sigma24 family protein